MIKNKMAEVVEAIVNPSLPTHVFIDADPIAYNGACAAEKNAYQWFYKGTDDEASEVLPNAEEAKSWLTFWEFSGEDPSLLERRTTKVVKPLQNAFDACDEVVKDYLKTAEKFCKSKDFKLTGYMTPSGFTKVKDIGGLENRYQFNRFDKEGNPLPKPKYLKECREYILNKYDWIKMAAEHYEADTHCIAMAEKYKDLGMIMSIDKDLDQCENTWYINMNPRFNLRTAVFATPLGELWEEFNPKGKGKVKGNGFKWLCFQAGAGDPSDGYKGLSGLGEKTLLGLLTPATTKVECVEALKTAYDKKLAKGFVTKDAKEAKAKPEKGFIKYLSWDNKRVKLDSIELMQQHFFLAYQERGPKDQFNVRYYLTTEEK